jgi:hypothetical protein
MDPGSVVLALALLCSLPAGLVLIGVLAHRSASASWLRRHARVLAWLAALAWGGLAARRWLAPDEASWFAALASTVAMLCMLAFAVLQPPGGASRADE